MSRPAELALLAKRATLEGVRHLPAPFLVVVAALLALAPSAHAAETLRIHDPITDNYKASFNADPSKPELRTWLAWRAVAAGGTSWRPTAPASFQFTQGAVAVNADDGRSGTLTVRVVSGSMSSPVLVRTDATTAASGGRWGPLGTVGDRDALRAAPAQLALALVVEGRELAAGVISYRYDATLAGVAPGHIEYNGPGGRWWVGSTATRTQEEPAPATAPTILASTAPAAGRPRITRLQLPLRTTRRVVTVRVFGRGNGARITHVRARIDGRRWGRWTTVRSSYALLLPRGNRVRTVRVQVRNAAGRTSLPALRRVRCYC